MEWLWLVIGGVGLAGLLWFLPRLRGTSPNVGSQHGGGVDETPGEIIGGPGVGPAVGCGLNMNA